jgi:hypothetical protein
VKVTDAVEVGLLKRASVDEEDELVAYGITLKITRMSVVHVTELIGKSVLKGENVITGVTTEAKVAVGRVNDS